MPDRAMDHSYDKALEHETEDRVVSPTNDEAKILLNARPVPILHRHSCRLDDIARSLNEGKDYQSSLEILSMDEMKRMKELEGMNKKKETELSKWNVNEEKKPVSPNKHQQITSALKKSPPSLINRENCPDKPRKGVRFGQGTKVSDEESDVQTAEDVGIFDMTDFDNILDNGSNSKSPILDTLLTPPTPEKSYQQSAQSKTESVPVPLFIQKPTTRRKDLTSPIVPPLDVSEKDGLRAALRRMTSSGSINATMVRARKDSNAFSSSSSRPSSASTIPSSTLGREAAKGKYLPDDQIEEVLVSSEDENDIEHTKPQVATSPSAQSLPINISFMNPLANPNPITGHVEHIIADASDDPIQHASYIAGKLAMKPDIPFTKHTKIHTNVHSASLASFNKSLMEVYKERKKSGKGTFVDSYKDYFDTRMKKKPIEDDDKDDDGFDPGSLAEYQHLTSKSGLFGPTP